MKQKRVYELEGAKQHARFKELRPAAAVCTASDRALPLVKAKLDGYLTAYHNLERNHLFSIVDRRDEYTVVSISDLQGPIFIVKSRRKGNENEIRQSADTPI